ncbi:MAG: LysE family translocator [Actinobacteria bacterium]|nr:LysE family translocator [Actinomycetota bacterium]
MGELAAFLGIAILVIVTPGQDTALTIRNTLLGSRHAGVATAAGVAAGQACWTAAASIGLAALLVASEPVFVALRLAGAAYLVYLGLQALWHAIRPTARPSDRPAGTPLAPRRAFRQGLLSNLGNPKMAIFFTSLLPQFGSSFGSLLVLGLLFCSLTLAWLSAYSFAVARAGDLLRWPRIRRPIEALTGTLLVAFGIRLAAAR